MKHAPTEAAHERRIEWALQEKLAGQAPPDRAAQVAARFRAESQRASGRRQRYAAALVLVAVGVVIAIAAGPGEPPLRKATDSGQGQALPRPVVVDTVAAALALPAKTRAVRCNRPSDAIVEALTRLRDLERLELRNGWRMSYGSMPERKAPPADASSVTDAVFATIAKFARLRRLELTGCWRLTGRGLHQLVRLPLLEDLSIRFSDTEDRYFATLKDLPSLRRLDVSFNYGFNRAAMAALTRCHGVHTVTLRGCAQIHPDDIGGLGAMRSLRSLDLTHLDTHSWRYDGGVSTPLSAGLQNLAGDFVDSRRNGVRNSSLRKLAESRTLRVLHLGPAQHRFTVAGLAALRTMATLEELSLSGLTQLDPSYPSTLPRSLRKLTAASDCDDTVCRALRAALPRLEHLDVSGSDAITNAGVRELLRLESLHTLSLRQCRGVTAPVLKMFLAKRSLRSLDLRDIGWVRDEHAARLREALPGLKVLTSATTDRHRDR